MKFLKILLLEFLQFKQLGKTSGELAKTKKQLGKTEKDNSMRFSQLSPSLKFSTLIKNGFLKEKILQAKKSLPTKKSPLTKKISAKKEFSFPKDFPFTAERKSPKRTEKNFTAKNFPLKLFLEGLVAVITGAVNIFLVIALIKQTSLPKSDLAYQNFFAPHFLESAHAQQTTPLAKSFSPLKIITYTVKPGDTLWSIAKETGINLDTILSFNHIDNSHKLMPKTTLNIPLQNGILHKVQKGESPDLEELSTRYTISAEKIRYFNQKTDDDYLFIPGATLSFSERLRLYGKEFFSPLGIRTVKVTSFFGFRIHPIRKNRSFHRGIDISSPIGTPVYAAKAGVVINTVFASGYGMLVIISHGQSTYTRYAHLSKFKVKPGQRVKAGQVIALSGNTGSSTGPHLHFEVLRGNKTINPIYLTDLARKK